MSKCSLQQNANLTDILKMATLPPHPHSHSHPHPRDVWHGNFEALQQENYVEMLRVDLYLNRHNQKQLRWWNS